MRAFLAVLAFAGFVFAVLLAAPSCGPSHLSKAYGAYSAQVEPLLDREAPVWKKLASLLNEQSQGEDPNFKRFAEALRAESIPFYKEFAAAVDRIQPGDPDLATAHAALVKFAKSRAEFVRVLAENLETVRIGDPESKMNVKDAALTSAAAAYGESINGEMSKADNRFSELIALETAFQTTCIEPLADGKATADDARDRIAKEILPKIKSLRATKFLDDEPSRRLRAAIAAAEEFFDAVVEDLPRMEAAARLRRASSTLNTEGEDSMKAFRDEMKAIRGRM
jgi:hypothetical protein